MKWLLVLAVLVCSCSIVTAGLEVQGEYDAVSGDCILSITGEAIFGLLISVDATSTSATLDFSNVEFPTGFDLPGKPQSVTDKYGEVTISNIFGEPKTGVMVSGIAIDFSMYMGEGPVIITALPGTSEGALGMTPIPGVIAEFYPLDCIPEPMTFGLLGIGVLFIRAGEA